MLNKHHSELTGLDAAQLIADSEGDRWVELFTELIEKRQLSIAIREMNELENDPVHGPLVRVALSRIGLN